MLNLFSKKKNLTLLTHLFKGSEMPVNIDRSFTGTQEQFWLDALAAATGRLRWVPVEVEPRLNF